MIELNNDQLIVRFPDVHEDAVCRIEFQRTLRIPDDNREYPLPPGLGRFALNHVDDYADKVPAVWRDHGGVFLPMNQAEAMWLNFHGDYPMAVKVAAGKVDALTGESWKNDLSKNPQDYLVLPDQPWLDGFCVHKGLIRQFVAMPLGKGYTAEEQLTEEAQHGGVQLVVYPMKAKIYEERCKRQRKFIENACYCLEAPSAHMDMGLAPGGLMRQEIYEDDYGFDAWDQSTRSRCFVHILNSLQFFAVSGSEPPGEPPTAKQYTNAGLPWFDYYAADQKALEGAKKLAGLDSVAAKKLKKGAGLLKDNDPLSPGFVKKLGEGKPVVREGEF